MSVTTIANKATNQLKVGAGYINQIIVTVPAAGTLLLPKPMFFFNGIQVITAGTTAGEMDVDWS